MKSRMAGVSLIEVAISVLVLSIGALGLASIQISAKRAGHEALQRTEATMLASDLIERMRANPAALSDYDTTGGVGVGVYGGSALSQPANNCDTKGECATASDVALWDMWEWQNAMDGATAMSGAVATGGLVDPVGCVEVSGRMVTVEIAWRGAETLSVIATSSGCGDGLYAAANANRQLLQVMSFVAEE